jgi:hypothetical protein
MLEFKVLLVNHFPPLKERPRGAALDHEEHRGLCFYKAAVAKNFIDDGLLPANRIRWLYIARTDAAEHSYL